MKAVIMAGGEGTRLRPLTLGSPKPMLPLLGRPVLEHLIGLLKSHGVTDLIITLGHQPQAVMDYFGDGTDFGVQLTYVLEEEPLGTAGSVAHCGANLGGEDFLVLSGDCVCDLDLGRLAAFHRERGAIATLALTRHQAPLEYGMVVTRPDGRVERFVEKPAWGQVVSDLVNTGIYVLSPAALERAPKGRAWDFGRDLFPALLAEDAPLYGCPLEGYWRDMGDCGDYLGCVCDALGGKVKLDPGLPLRAPGIWADQPVPEGVALVPPCWIGPQVRLEPGCLIGPHVVLDRGAWVGEKAMVQRSVLLEGAGVGPHATLYGAILDRNSTARRGAVLNEGAVLGENALAEEGAQLLERVKLWPGQRAEAGCRLTRSVTSGSQKGSLRFGDGGTIQGVLGEDLGPEALLTLGSILGTEGPVGLGCSNTPAGRMLARAAAAGISAAGGMSRTGELDCPVQWAWAAGKEKLAITLFVEAEGEGAVYLHFFDSRGLPPDRVWERKLEHAMAQGELRRVRAERVTEPQRLELSARLWAETVAHQAALGRPFLRRPTVGVARDTSEDRALGLVLKALGCQVEDRWRPGIPAFSAGHGGFRLTAQDEKGVLLDSGQLLTLVTLIEMENGGGKVAVPAGGSAAVDLVAAGYGGTVLRLDRDGEEAQGLYASLPWLWAAPSAAARICARMGTSGQKLEALMAKTPRFHAWRREVPLLSDRGRVMQALAGDRARPGSGEGLRVRTGNGWVYLTPLARRQALRILAEGPDLELAAELCDFFAQRAIQADRESCAQSTQGETKK